MEHACSQSPEDMDRHYHSCWSDIPLHGIRSSRNGPGQEIVAYPSEWRHFRRKRSCQPVHQEHFPFSGVEEISQLFVEGMDTYPDRADEIVADAIEKAKQLAKTF